jgi:hypothetical protein
MASRILCFIIFFSVLIFDASHKKSFAETDLVDSNDDKILSRSSLNKPLAVGEFYELVNDNLRPNSDEFYVSSIFTIKGKPKALIKRSINKRASDLYINNCEYGIGDYLAPGYKIKDISFTKKEVLVLEESSGDIYGLTVTYGDAKSRLTKKGAR